MRQDAREAALEVHERGAVQTWEMRLEPVNALNDDMLASLEAALDAATADEDVAAVVIASGLRVFSAGADATWMARAAVENGTAGLLEEFNLTMDRFRRVCVRIRQAPFLVIACLEGHTLAGGLELAAACDLRFCSDSEKLRVGVPEMDLFGCLPTGGGGAQFLTRLMGQSRALHFMLSAKPITPTDAYSAGLVDRLTPGDEVRSHSLAFAQEVADKAGRIGVSGAKRAVFSGGELPLAPAMVLDASLHWDTMRRGNFQAGVQAFADQFASRCER